LRKPRRFDNISVDNHGNFLSASTREDNRQPSSIYGKSRSAAAVGGFVEPRDIGAGTFAILRDPYTAPMKIRFEEAWRMDPVVRSAINRKVSFTLGREFKTVLDIIETFPNRSEYRAALNQIMSDQEYKNARAIVDRLNRKVNFQHCLKAAVIQSKVYGRSALLIDGPLKDPETGEQVGIPRTGLDMDMVRLIDVKTLSSKLLGQVKINENTWALQAVLYNTTNRGVNDPTNYIKANRLIYFTNVNYHISPQTIHYGYSDIEPIAHISECNRIINEEDMKEINFTMWAGFGLIKIPGTRNVTDVEQFLANFKGGRWSVISSDIQVEVHQLTNDLKALIEERRENEQLILRALNVPAMILGFEDIQNYATAQQVLMAWKESVIEEERTHLNQTVQPQWFDRAFASALNIEDVWELTVEMKLAFEDIAFENIKDRALAYLPIYEAGLIPDEKILEIFGLDDVIDQLKELQQKKEQAQQEIQQRMNEQAQKEQQQSQGTGEGIKFPSTGGRALLEQIQKAEGKNVVGQPQQQEQQQQK
jgi:hypothetical protein